MRWGLLVRISDARDDDEEGVGRQEKDGRREVERRGGQVVKLYRENSVSAFKRRVITLPDGTRARRVVRPEFRTALGDLYDGNLIDALMVYDLDRFVRDPRDLEDAIDVAEEAGRPIASVTGSLDLSTDHGIMLARMMVAHANQSSRDTSRRVKRMHIGLAEEGKPSGGRRAYGYDKYRLEVVPDEAAVIRELARRRLAGEGWVSLVRDLNRRGIPAASGGRWSLSSIRSVLMNPHVAGIRTLRGEETADGTWEPILDRGTWEQLRALAAVRRPPSRRYLLSGIARCGLCGGGLGGRPIKGVPVYRCANPDCLRITRRMAPLDEYVTGAVIGMLADLDLSDAPARSPDTIGEIAALTRRRNAVVAAFADIGGDDPMELRRALAELDGQIDRLRKQTAGGQRTRLLAGHVGVSRADWDALPLDTRRAVVASLVTVTVGRSKRGRVPFDVSSVRIQPV